MTIGIGVQITPHERYVDVECLFAQVTENRGCQGNWLRRQTRYHFEGTNSPTAK